ncbi:unnamed protein product [Ceutorhynchus assimilis]|uniref:Uncharacterized protein n=1 Tax=Ceutorhynchus assimilis TaxID=467358 RepID=A0A9N9MQQ7_9CUCU|nr:unnamed protein product [Ceutorhynchus assimilis]
MARKSHFLFKTQHQAVELEASQFIYENTDDVNAVSDIELPEFSSQPVLINPTPMPAEDVHYCLTAKDSIDPSYTRLTLPYTVICRQRYRKACAKQKAQFAEEIKMHAMFRARALDGVRIHREFCNAIISQIHPSEKITLTKKQEKRVRQLLTEP